MVKVRNIFKILIYVGFALVALSTLIEIIRGGVSNERILFILPQIILPIGGMLTLIAHKTKRKIILGCLYFIFAVAYANFCVAEFAIMSRNFALMFQQAFMGNPIALYSLGTIFSAISAIVVIILTLLSKEK